MKSWILGTSLAAASIAATTAFGQEYFFSERYIPTGPNSYVYDRTWGHDRTPDYYDPGAYRWGYGYRPYTGYRALPPYGFGDPSYTGYNDPYYHTYGPAVQDFLRFGGADFYGF